MASKKSASTSPPVASAPQQSEGKKAKVGFTVALLEDDTFYFDIIGEKPGVLECVGLLELAKEYIYTDLHSRIGTGVPALAKMIKSMSEKPAPVPPTPQENIAL
jgi:hypothetical protein